MYKNAHPSPAQIAQAKKSFEDRLEKQRKARETNMARQDPVTRQILKDAFSRLDLVDPNGNIGAAIARYPLDYVLSGIATFQGKRDAKTLPQGADAR